MNTRGCFWKLRRWGGTCALMLVAAVPAHAEKTTYYVTNAQGTVVATMDSQAHVTYTAAYRPYGQQAKGAPQPGPGYTGHVNDPATGLVYMQQRYYDPEVGRFISPDPVGPAAGNVFNIGRYTYANNNPVRYNDPDGREVVFVLRNAATASDRTATMNYLAKSPTARHEIRQIENSGETYTIVFDRSAQDMGYNEQTRTVTLNPTSGLVIKSSGAVQSPAIGAGHEISHAAEHDRVGTEAFEKKLETPVVSVKNAPDGGMTVTYGVAAEESRATIVESKIAKDLNEAQRDSYNDSQGAVKTCGPTSINQC